MIRVFYTILIVGLAPLLPWWAGVALAVGGFFIFPNYLEPLAFFLVYDAAFGLPSQGWLGTQFSLTVVCAVLYLLIEGQKHALRFYDA